MHSTDRIETEDRIESGDGINDSGSDVTLLVIADYDILKRELTNVRLDDGNPVPITTLIREGVKFNVLPAVFNSYSEPLWLGRTRRRASYGQRIAITPRDGGCVRCAAPPERCHAHHITWWSNGGNTDVNNLCFVCTECHTLIHNNNWQIAYQNGKPQLRPPPVDLHPQSNRSPHRLSITPPLNTS